MNALEAISASNRVVLTIYFGKVLSDGIETRSLDRDRIGQRTVSFSTLQVFIFRKASWTSGNYICGPIGKIVVRTPCVVFRVNSSDIGPGVDSDDQRIQQHFDKRLWIHSSSVAGAGLVKLSPKLTVITKARVRHVVGETTVMSSSAVKRPSATGTGYGETTI